MSAPANEPLELTLEIARRYVEERRPQRWLPVEPTATRRRRDERSAAPSDTRRRRDERSAAQ